MESRKRKRETPWLFKHGQCSTFTEGIPEFHVWKGMIQRCTWRRAPGWHNYGGRGIKVCDRWRHDFNAFISDVGRRPTPDHTLDRIDNNGNYEPGNVRWATRLEQAQNRRTTGRYAVLGFTKTLREWSELNGVSVGSIRNRLLSGWTLEDAILRGKHSEVQDSTLPIKRMIHAMEPIL